MVVQVIATAQPRLPELTVESIIQTDVPIFYIYSMVPLFQNCDMSETDYDGRTAVHLAAAEGHVGCVQVHAIGG